MGTMNLKDHKEYADGFTGNAQVVSFSVANAIVNDLISSNRELVKALENTNQELMNAINVLNNKIDDDDDFWDMETCDLNAKLIEKLKADL